MTRVARRLARTGTSLAAKSREVETELLTEWRFRRTVSVDKLEAEQARLFRRRGRLATRRVVPLLRRELAWLDSLHAYVASGPQIALSSDQRGAVTQLVDRLRTGQERLGDRITALLISD